MSTLRVNEIQTTGGLSNRGKILQVVSNVKTDISSSAGGFVWTDTGLTVNITPRNTSSTILIMSDLFVSSNVGYSVKVRLVRDGSAIYIGDAAGSRPRVSKEFTATYHSTNAYNGQPLAIMYVDSPASSGQLTYKIQMASYSTYVVYLNRQGTDANTSEYDSRCASSLIAMEIAG